MNLIPVDPGGALRVGDAVIAIADPNQRQGTVTRTELVGFRPESIVVGSGPLRGRVRTVEDLGSEVFVHLLVEHRGEEVAVVVNVEPPFTASPNEVLAWDIKGPAHLFDGAGALVGKVSVTVEGQPE